MSTAMPPIGADVILEFQQSISNITMFGQAMEGLDSKFGSMETKINNLKSSLTGLSSQVSRGAGRNLRAEMEKELNNLVAGNGVVLSKMGTAPLKVDGATIKGVFQKIEKEINLKLAESYKNIMIDVQGGAQVGKVPISATDLDEVNKAIGRLVKVQLNNLVAALRKQGAGLISSQDLASLQFSIGKGTVQQIINKVKQEIQGVLLKPTVAQGVTFSFTEKDMANVMNKIKSHVKTALDNSVSTIGGANSTVDLSGKIQQLHNAVNDNAREYIQHITQGMNSMSASSFSKPLTDLSAQLRKFMAKELGTDVESFNRIFANQKFTTGEVHSAELRRQFARLEQVLNRKIGGGLNEEIKQMISQIDSVQINYSPKLRYNIVQEINRINNRIVKKIREQIDLQFQHMQSEIDTVQVAPKDINRVRRIRDMGRVQVDGQPQERAQQQRTIANDPYARRDNYMNGFGLEGAIVNTLRHVMAGAAVGAPMMLMYQSFEQFKTSQLEQVKMFSNFFAQADAETKDRAAVGDTRDASEVANDAIKSIIPYVQQASKFYGIDYGKTSQIASVGSRLLDTPEEVKTFTNVVGKIYSIDREGDPVSNIAPGLEAFMGQFDLSVGELENRVLQPLAVATNLTNATTESVMSAIARSGSTFKMAGVSPEQAIGMVATSIKYTGLSGENIGNFYKSILPRLQSDSALKELSSIGVNVYDNQPNGSKKARSASDILEEVSGKYQQLDDPKARQVVMDLFGTYQSSKGMTTLDELDSYKKIMDAMKDFSSDDLTSLLGNNLNSGSVEMQRAMVSAELSLTSILEELKPEINGLSRVLGSLSEGVTANKEAIGNFVRFLADALVGFATVFAARKLWNYSGAPAAIDRVVSVDKVLGNPGILGKGASSGILGGLAGVPNIRQGVLENSKANRGLIGSAMDNPVLSPYVKQLGNMSPEQVANMKTYIQDNNLLVKDMKDLMNVAHESMTYTPKNLVTDPTKVWGGSQQAVNNLYKNGAMGIDKNFTTQLATDLTSRQTFDQLSQTPDGSKVTSFLANADEQELAKFRQHLEELHRTSGTAIKDVAGLSRAVDTYSSAQQANREELRRTNPELIAMNDQMGRIMGTVSSNQGNMSKFDRFMGGLSSKARGAATAFAGLGRSIATMGAQMAVFAALGEVMSNFAIDTRKPEQVALDKSEKQIQDINEYQKQMGYGEFHYRAQTLADSAKGLWDMLTPGRDKYTDSNDTANVGNDLTKFLNEKYGAQLPLHATPDAQRKNAQSYIKQIGKSEDDVFSEYKNWDGGGDHDSVMKTLKDAQAAEYKRQLAEMMLQGQEQDKIKEGVDQKSAERIKKDRMEGQYQTYDLETIKGSVGTDVEKINSEYSFKELQTLNQGYASDSDEYLKLRREQTQKIVDLYRSELDKINQFIADLETKIASMKTNGASPDEIKAAEDDLARWKENKTQAEGEFGTKAYQSQSELDQTEFDARMSKVNRNASKRDSALNMQDALNQSTMDRDSQDYIDATKSISAKRIKDLQAQMKELADAPITADQKEQVQEQISQLQSSVAQEKVKVRDLNLSSINTYKEGMNDKLSQWSNDYLQAKVKSGITDDDNPYLRNLRIDQYDKQVGLFNGNIATLQKQLDGTNDPEAQKQLQREIRDLQQKSLQAQLGILDEMKNTGGTFNLPDNVQAMSYYEYLTRNNSHSTYTVQGGDTSVTITLPNITDGTSSERIKQIGKALGEGINDGKNLRLQKQANPFGYKTL